MSQRFLGILRIKNSTKTCSKNEITSLKIKVKSLKVFCHLMKMLNLFMAKCLLSLLLNCLAPHSVWGYCKQNFISVIIMEIFCFLYLSWEGFYHVRLNIIIWVVLYQLFSIILKVSNIYLIGNLQSQTKYLRQTSVFMWNNTLREKFYFCF